MQKLYVMILMVGTWRYKISKWTESESRPNRMADHLDKKKLGFSGT